MIRRVLLALPKSVISSLYSTSCQSVNIFSCISKPIVNQQKANFASITRGFENSSRSSDIITKYTRLTLLEPKETFLEQIRTLIKFSLKKGKRKTVRTVPKRFFRLHWGIWVRTMAGRNRLWAKKKSRRTRLLSHVFCNATQSHMLDKMVNKFWRRPKYFLDDPYAVYHQREYFEMTRKKPWRPEGVDYE